MKTKLRKTYNILIRLLVLVFTVIFIYDQVFNRKDLSSLLVDFKTITSGFWSDILLLLVIGLIPVNLLFESLKWKYLISKLEHVTIFNSMRAFLRIGRSTPN